MVLLYFLQDSKKKFLDDPEKNECQFVTIASESFWMTLKQKEWHAAREYCKRKFLDDPEK